uniref:Phospholipid scramblase n=1 Tax=Gasterosteus aculeatus aculeatus TaxID=481459 RepID=A0AAQ4PL27_GASAC|nr:phospholipid scramblase 2 isoform X1 [Gasterosteus aculeatus aculeatus]
MPMVVIAKLCIYFQFYTMSVVTNQPLPFGQLEREKHIQMVFTAFHKSCVASCECRRANSLGPEHQQKAPRCESDEQLLGLAPERRVENVCTVSQPGVEVQGSHFMSALETVSQMHVTARPELQGPQCVPKKIYSITAGSSRSPLFVAVEESSCVCLQCCGPARASSLQGFDGQGRQVFHFERPLRVDACCLGCCLMEMRAYTPQKRLFGTVCQRWSMFTPLLEVCGSEEASARVRVQGSCCPQRCLSNQQFQIVSNMGEKLGTIWKKWPGFNVERNMDHEHFGLEVPLNMESHTKLLLLAATFLLNYMFFEMS